MTCGIAVTCHVVALLCLYICHMLLYRFALQHPDPMHPTKHKATIFLFLGLRISWPEKRVGRSEKKKKKKLHGNSSKKWCFKDLGLFLEIYSTSAFFFNFQ